MNLTAFWHTFFKFTNLFNSIECIRAIDIAAFWLLMYNACWRAKFLFFHFFHMQFSFWMTIWLMDCLMIEMIRAWKVLNSMANTMKAHSEMVSIYVCWLGSILTECFAKWGWICIIANSTSKPKRISSHILAQIIQTCHSRIKFQHSLLDNWIYHFQQSLNSKVNAIRAELENVEIIDASHVMFAHCFSAAIYIQRLCGFEYVYKFARQTKSSGFDCITKCKSAA